jgi:hypothetical protein
MAEPDPIKNDRRRARKTAKLPPGATCLLCAEESPEKLQQVGRSVLEAHHVLGEGIAPELTVVLCRNCHAEQTQRQLDAGVELRWQRRTVLETAASVLVALGAFLLALGGWLLDLGHHVEALVAGLDRDHPGWRELSEAWL